MLEDVTQESDGASSAQSDSIEDLVNRATLLAQARADALRLTQDEAKVLFTYTLEQLMVMLYMRRPEEVDGLIDRLRGRVKQDFGMTSRLPN